MKTQDFLISYIIVHIIPLPDWAVLSYRRKKDYHYLVTVNGKTISLKPLEHKAGCVEVVFVGSERYANDSAALFSLLLDLWIAHPDAKIVYAEDLYHSSSTSPIVKATCWLVHHMPRWLRKKLPKCSNLFTLHSMLPLIY